MGAPSSQVQSSQSSLPAGKGASASPSSPGGSSMSATSGHPMMGNPNTNSNVGGNQVTNMNNAAQAGAAGKGASASPSYQPMGKGGASMSATSGQPTMGQPNTNSNTPMAMPQTNMMNPSMVAQGDGQTSGNPYPNTIGGLGSVAGGPNGQPQMNQSNFGGGKGKGA